MSASYAAPIRSTLNEFIFQEPPVLFPGGDVELLDPTEDQELIMGNLIMSAGSGTAIRTGGIVNDSDSALLMSEMENTEDDENRRLTYDHFETDDHCHGPVPKEDIKSRNQLIAVCCFCFFFMVAEIIGGVVAHSLAIATDATHLACDLAGFLVSLFAIWISKKPPTRRMTFGYYRAEVVGALVSVLLIWALTAVLIVMAIIRIKEDDYEINGVPMIITASLGVFFNVVMGVVLHSGLFNSCNFRVSFGHGHSHGGHGHSHRGHGHSHGGHGHSHNHNVINRPPRSVVMPTDDDNDDFTFSRNSEFDRAAAGASVAMCDFASGVLDDGDLDASFQLTGSANGVVPVGEGRSRSKFSCFNVSDNLNVRAAFVHVVGDLIQSIGVFVAALIIIIKPEYKMADPICTFVFSFLVLCTTLCVIKDVLNIILEGTPSSINYQEVKSSLANLPGVKMVHCLNVWSITVDKIALNVHLAVCNPQEDWDKVLKSATSMLRSRYNIFLPTIQVEPFEEVMKHCSRCAHP